MIILTPPIVVFIEPSAFRNVIIIFAMVDKVVGFFLSEDVGIPGGVDKDDCSMTYQFPPRMVE